jgi:ABC-type sugar transport system substrate-binding protein
MDPRERADAILARARARGAFVVTPESAVSPMDAANTLQIPRAVVAAADERDSETTMVVPAVAGVPGRDELPAIAQEALTDVVAVPHPGPRSRQRRLEQHQSMLAAQAAARAAVEPEVVEGLVPTVKEPPVSGSLSQRLEG